MSGRPRPYLLALTSEELIRSPLQEVAARCYAGALREICGLQRAELSDQAGHTPNPGTPPTR
jgi:hypothetical protein